MIKIYRLCASVPLPARLMILAVIGLAISASWGCGDDGGNSPSLDDPPGDGSDDDSTGLGDDSTGTGGDSTDVGNDSTGTGDGDGGEVSDSANILVRVTVPETTPPDSNVYIAGNFQGWDPGDDDYRLSPLSSQLFEITLTLKIETAMQFKFTLGDWSRVEKGPNGEEIANRTHTVNGRDTLDLEVSNWAGGSAGSTITGDVSLVEVPGFLNGRRVWVYLPPGYDPNGETRYPVLYMLDGQNVFDQATSFAGEWEVDESCESLIAGGEMRPVIVVAVANGEGDRVDEYTPWRDSGYGAGGGGEEHLQEFADTLIPWINANYRTATGPENTGFAGSSLGGLMALYAAYTRGDTYGLIASLSPSIGWDDGHLIGLIDSLAPPDSKIYMDMGTREGGGIIDGDQNGIDDNIDRLRAVRDQLIADGFVPGGDLMVVEDEGGRHNEGFWAVRFPAALRFLFPPVERR